MKFTMASERVQHDEVFDLLVASGIFADVTVELTPSVVGRAFDGSNLVTVARDDHGKMIGVCRALTDFSRNCFIATLAVHPLAKGQGVGKALLNFTHAEAGDPRKIVIFLHSGPEAVGFYERIGMERETTMFSLNNVN